MINIKQLSYAFSKKNPIFDNFDLDIPRGKVIGLLGNNGAGKTTLFNLIASHYLPQKGTIQIEQFNSASRSAQYLSQVFLMPEQLFLPNIKIGKLFKSCSVFYKKFSHDILKRCLSEFELDEKQSLKSLSLGQKKKAYLSFGLATNSNYYLLDEPTNGLDIESKAQFKKLILELMNEERTFLISTHQIKEINSIIDHLIILHDKQCLINSSIEQLTASYCFETVADLELDRNILYSEKNAFGYRIMLEGEAKDEFDIEFFYKALIHNKDFNFKPNNEERAS